MSFYYSRYHIPRFLPLKWALKFREATGIPPVYNQKSREQKLIFIHIPKAAGSSVGELLLGTDRVGHYPFEIYESYNSKWFNEFFKFSVCREPLARFKSAFYYLQTGGKGSADAKIGAYLGGFEGGINEFVCNGFSESFAMSNAHFFPQHKFVYDNNDNLVVDKLCRLENLDNDLQSIIDRFASGCKLRKSNLTSFSKKEKEDLAPESIKIIKDVYRKDYELLGYEK